MWWSSAQAWVEQRTGLVVQCASLGCAVHMGASKQGLHVLLAQPATAALPPRQRPSPLLRPHTCFRAALKSDMLMLRSRTGCGTTCAATAASAAGRALLAAAAAAAAAAVAATVAAESPGEAEAVGPPAPLPAALAAARSASRCSRMGQYAAAMHRFFRSEPAGDGEGAHGGKGAAGERSWSSKLGTLLSKEASTRQAAPHSLHLHCRSE